MTQTALVTGSNGFLGRHFVRELESRDWDVVTMDGEDLSNDVRALWYETVDDTYDLVVHCAAVGPNRVAMATPSMNLATNVQLDATLFNWAVQTNQRHVLYISSSAIYPVELQTIGLNMPGTEVLLSEGDVHLDDPEVRAPDGDYGWTKWLGERVAHRARALGLHVTIVRPFSGYGEDQDPEHFPFPAIMRRVCNGNLTVWGPPGQRRDWIHVDDVVRGALAIAETTVNETVNLCTGIGTTFGDLVVAMALELELELPIAHHHIIYDETKPTGVFHRVGDPAHMHEFYEPKVTLREGIQRAVRAAGA